MSESSDEGSSEKEVDSDSKDTPKLRKNPERETRSAAISVPEAESSSSEEEGEELADFQLSESYFCSKPYRSIRKMTTIFEMGHVTVEPLKPVEVPELDPQLVCLPLNMAVLSVFRKIGIDFRCHQIELTPGELFSMCIGLRYLSVRGHVKVVKGTKRCFQRIRTIMEEYCSRADRNAPRYIIPSF
jgi:hypothetical protein